jgi:hypothetical protein
MDHQTASFSHLDQVIYAESLTGISVGEVGKEG